MTRGIVLAALVAGTLATIVQLALWLAAGDDVGRLLARDTRMTAAVALGRGVLAPPYDFTAATLATASAVHLAISLGWAVVAAVVVRRLPRVPAWLSGVALGIVVYVVDLHGFTRIFPWFVESRGAVTLAAHIVFGIALAITLRRLS